MIIDCISDLHGHYPELEGGDLLIVAGDLTARDTQEELDKFDSWLESTPYKKKIFIAGNHDNLLLKEVPRKYKRETKNECTERFEYLCDSGTEFEGLKIWGSPWTKRFLGMNPKCMAFTCDTDQDLGEKWALIPEDTDILVTHSPPYGTLDTTTRGESVGSFSLLKKATKLPNLKLFCWGHIHEGYGIHTPQKLKNLAKKEILGPATCKSFPYLINASHVNERYKPVNKPIRIIL